MKKFIAILILLTLNNIQMVLADNSYNINSKELARNQHFAEYYAAFTNPSQLANVQTNNAQQMYQQQIANQTGVPYEVYICQGNWQCIQQFELQRRQIQALQNQRVQINTDVNYRYRY